MGIKAWAQSTWHDFLMPIEQWASRLKHRAVDLQNTEDQGLGTSRV